MLKSSGFDFPLISKSPGETIVPASQQLVAQLFATPGQAIMRVTVSWITLYDILELISGARVSSGIEISPSQCFAYG
jgi:hypothetical protein